MRLRLHLGSFPALLVLASLLLAAPAARAQPGSVCPSLEGASARQCVRAAYAPSATLSYAAARDRLFGEIDADASGTVEGIYSGFTATLDPAADPSADADAKGLSAEHVFPQSKGAGQQPQRSDLHNLFPARAAVNSARGNLPFGESPDTQTDAWYRLEGVQSSVPTSDIDAYSERLGSALWEPREAVEGDVARAALYFFAVWEASADAAFFAAMRGQLVAWHEADPATQAERARSSAVAALQGNENPFVLDPTLARRVFGAPPPGAPTLAFEPVVATVPETAGSVTLTVRLTGPSGTAPVGAEVELVPTLSTAGTEDVGGFTSAAVAFPASAAGGATRTVTVPLTDDTRAEGTEVARFRLTAATGAGVGADDTFALTLTDDDNVLVINEVLYDPPPGTAGDANGDGTRDAREDEFIEIYNTSQADAVSLTGYVLVDVGVGVRHAFRSGTEVPPQGALVLFGGGEPARFGTAAPGAQAIPGVVQAAGGTLGLNNGGDAFRIEGPDGQALLTFSYDGSVANESLTRQPDGTGPFVAHTEAAPGVLFSPGRTADGGPLPVELTRFTAAATGGQTVTLAWATAAETNSAGFAIEQQQPDGTLAEIAFVEGAGTTTEAQTYRHAVPYVSAGRHTFRLRQVDFDGAAVIAGEVDVAVELAGAYALAAYPNPLRAGTNATIDLTAREAQRVEVALYDVLGRRVAVLFDGEVGASETERLTLSGRGLASGVYVVRVVGERFTATRRVTVVR